MEITEFILSEGLIIVPTLWIIGTFIKMTKFVEGSWVPFILLGISIILTPQTLDGGFNVDNVIQAILLAGVAVLGHQFIVQGEIISKNSKNKKVKESNLKNK